jgi:hypothetical protein
MEPLRSPRSPAPAPNPPPRTTREPRSAGGGRIPQSSSAGARSPPHGHPLHPTLAASSAPQPQIEPTPHSASSTSHASPPRRPVLKSIVVGPQFSGAPAVASGAADKAGGRSGKRVKFASPLCTSERHYYSNGTSASKSCLRSAAAKLATGAPSAEHSTHPLLAASPCIDGGFPSRGSPYSDGASQHAAAAHSSTPTAPPPRVRR